MKTKIQGIGRLEVAIVIAILILAAVIVLAIKVNKQKLPEKESMVRKLEEKEVISIKKLSVTPSKMKIAEEVDEKKITRYERKKVIKEQDDYIEDLRQKQMEKLRKDLKELTVEREKEDTSSEEIPATTTRHNIHPTEEDIRKMEKEKAVLY